jgi:hypothetical protein
MSQYSPVVGLTTMIRTGLVSVLSRPDPQIDRKEIKAGVGMRSELLLPEVLKDGNISRTTEKDTNILGWVRTTRGNIATIA